MIYVINIFILTFLIIILSVYCFYKTKRAFLVIQQSGYDNKRFIRYFKTGYKDTFPLNEVLLFLCSILMIYNYYVGLFLMLFVAYYNQKFMYKVVTRYTEKKKLKITSRVKRLIFTFTILNIIIFSVLFLICGYLTTLIVLIPTYILLVYITLLLSNIINIPAEKYVKNYYIKLAKNKLKERSDLFIVGITGSYGKTSIKNIIGSVLNDIEPTLITPESFNTPMGLTITVNNYLDVFHKNFIAEMGAYYNGEIRELARLVSPKVGIVSSVGPQHLETFGSIETVLKTKLELIEELPSDGLGILNLDNEYIKSYKVKNDVKIKYYSLLDDKADIYASNIKIVNGKTTFDCFINNEKYTISTKLLGKHNVENILAALLVCEYKNLDMNKVVTAISNLNAVDHRLQYKKINNELSIIDDAFNSNPSGIKEAINVLNSFEDKVKIIITPGLIDLGSETKNVHLEVSKLIKEYCDYCYIISETNKKYFEQGLDDYKNVKYYDNFIDGYNDAINIDGSKVILIANDLPDKFR